MKAMIFKDTRLSPLRTKSIAFRKTGTSRIEYNINKVPILLLVAAQCNCLASNWLH